MRVSKLTETALLKDPQVLYEKLKTIGFFSGKQVLIIEGSTDKISKLLSEALDNWSKEDTTLILIANTLKKTSSLRKLAEQHASAICVPIYEEQRDIKNIEKIIDNSELTITDKNIVRFLKNPHNFSSYNSFLSLIEKLELYKFDDPTPVTFNEIELFLSDSDNPSIYEIINFLSNGDTKELFFSLKRISNTGFNTNQIINAVHKHFSLLHKLSLNLGNPDFVLNKNYPPIFGQRRQQIIGQSQVWSTNLIERALNIINEVEKEMRSSSKLSLTTSLERSFLRILSLIKPIT